MDTKFPRPFQQGTEMSSSLCWPECNWPGAIAYYEQHHEAPPVPEALQKRGLRQTDYALVVQFLANWARHDTLTAGQLTMASGLPLIAEALWHLCMRHREALAQELWDGTYGQPPGDEPC